MNTCEVAITTCHPDRNDVQWSMIMETARLGVEFQSMNRVLSDEGIKAVAFSGKMWRCHSKVTQGSEGSLRWIEGKKKFPYKGSYPIAVHFRIAQRARKQGKIKQESRCE